MRVTTMTILLLLCVVAPGPSHSETIDLCGDIYDHFECFVFRSYLDG